MVDTSPTAFKQQQLKAWQPILTPIPVITSFIIVGVLFIPIGAFLLIVSNSVVEVSQRYDDNPNCPLNSSCTIVLTVPEEMKAPVYMYSFSMNPQFRYYGLENFNQNHRRYVKSRNDEQLRGDVVDSFSSLEACDPLKSRDGSTDPKDFFLPCGLIAASVFNDTFVLRTNASVIPLRKEGIAWKSDREKKFKNPPASAPGIRVIADFEDEDFIVWMRTAGLPSFKKLYRIVDQTLPPGDYSVDIANNFPVDGFDGKKFVVLSTTSWMGGKNPFLGYAYIVVGVVCVVLGVAFAIKHRLSPRKLGDTKYLDWNK